MDKNSIMWRRTPSGKSLKLSSSFLPPLLLLLFFLHSQLSCASFSSSTQMLKRFRKALKSCTLEAFFSRLLTPFFKVMARDEHKNLHTMCSKLNVLCIEIYLSLFKALFRKKTTCGYRIR